MYIFVCLFVCLCWFIANSLHCTSNTIFRFQFTQIIICLYKHIYVYLIHKDEVYFMYFFFVFVLYVATIWSGVFLMSKLKYKFYAKIEVE